MLAGSSFKPAIGDKVWASTDFAGRNDWIYRLSDAALADIAKAIGKVRDRGGALDDVIRTDFDLPSLAGDLGEISRILGQGRGFVLIKGLGEAGYTEDELAIAFWGIGTHIGTGVSQSYHGDRLGHVRDIGEKGRYYTVGGELEMHMDPTDVVGLVCVQPAISGGLSRIASSLNIHNIILQERPDLMETLYNGFFYRRRDADVGGSGKGFNQRIPAFAELDGSIVCHYLPLSIRNAAESGAELTAKEREALALVNDVATRPDVRLDMDFKRGDIQFLNNRVTLHSRTDYTDPPDPALKRHLLRLWLMMDSWPALPAHLRMQGPTDRAGGGVAKAAV
ncbi:MAG: TauD/TfdA family dioxygenase [Hyphomicrobiaceae bacterium]